MKLILNRHYPQYPVTDRGGRLVGLVRGAALFELEAFEITAQAGSMVGVEKEERIATPIRQSFKFRNPWLLMNLLTAFVAGGVVAMFQGTIDRLVILATFLPGALEPGRQHRLPGARGHGARHHAGRREGGPRQRAHVEGRRCSGWPTARSPGSSAASRCTSTRPSQGSPHAPMLGLVVAMAMVGKLLP